MDSALFQKRNGLRYLPNSIEPYSGSAYSLYANGDKKTESNWEDGKIDGEFIFYYENGEKKIEAHYSEGKQDGKITKWYRNGQKEEESNWKDDNKDGVTTFGMNRVR